MTFRKILLNFNSIEDLNKLSDKLFENSDRKLLPNLKEVHITKSSIDVQVRKTVKTKPKEQEWEKHWVDLTPFVVNDLDKIKIMFYFSEEFSNEDISELLEQKITSRTTFTYFPKQPKLDINKKRVHSTRGNPQYPIYIISKGRWYDCITADHLIKMNVPFRIVIEKQEWDKYAEVYDEKYLLELDMRFKDEYNTYIPDFDESRSKGSGPARNFVWWHSKEVMKADWHWIFDDNIQGFFYYNDKERLKSIDGSIFTTAEDFIQRYENIGIAGFNYYSFCIPSDNDKPYTKNTKIYSGLLIRNDLPFRWQGRYNEDVDICIRALKEGYSTLQFQAFLSYKMETQTMPGGNTDAFYAEEGTLPKSNQLYYNHPDITDVVWRFKRWHHHVHYEYFDRFANRTIKETIQALNEPRILCPIEDSEIIQEIKELNLLDVKDYDELLLNVDSHKRNRVIEILKFYRYSNDNERIIQRLTEDRALESNLSEYIWNEEIPDTVDNNIMKDLLKLGDSDGKLFHAVNWDEFWKNYENVPHEKKKRIQNEMQRNKFLRHREYPKYSYNWSTYILSRKDHLEYRDSLNEYLNSKDSLNREVPLTRFDKKCRGIISNRRDRKFTDKRTTRHEEIVKKDGYALMIHGSEDFDNSTLFKEMLNVPEQCNEIINSVHYKIDLMSANYALENKLIAREFVPDEALHTNNAFRVIYKKMAEYADECVLFIKTKTPDLEYLIQEFKKLNKPISIHYDVVTESLEDW